jgi:hypothetical protein
MPGLLPAGYVQPLYEQRRREDGHELDDWLQAESEVTQQKAKTVAA